MAVHMQIHLYTYIYIIYIYIWAIDLTQMICFLELLQESQTLNLSSNSLSPRPSGTCIHSPRTASSSVTCSKGSAHKITASPGGTIAPPTKSSGVRRQVQQSISEGSDWDDWSDNEPEVCGVRSHCVIEWVNKLISESVTTILVYIEIIGFWVSEY